MKKEKQIIVAIDFSKCSIKALQLGIILANQCNGNILMVHVDKPQYSESIYSKVGQEHKKTIIANLDKLVKKYQPCFKGKLEYKVRKGKVHSEIANQAKYSDAYLIIAGSHGISGYEQFWIGSNAFKIVTLSPCPVITVRENFTWGEGTITRIVVPIDSTLETRQKVPVAAELAKLFNSEIHILGLYSTTVKDVKKVVESYVKQTVDFIEAEGVKCVKHFKSSENVTECTLDYVNEVKAELIAIMSEQEKSTRNIWLGPYAQQMVNHSPVPVLTVHSKNFYDVQTRKD